MTSTDIYALKIVVLVTHVIKSEQLLKYNQNTKHWWILSSKEQK